MTSDPPPDPLPLRPGLIAAAGLLALIVVGSEFLPLPAGHLWTHVKYGRWIIEHRQIPDAEPFTPGWATGDAKLQFTVLDTLADVVLGWAATPVGLVAIRTVLVLLKYLFLLMAVRRRAPLGPPLVVALLAAVALDWPTLGALRPESFAQVLFAAVLVPLGRERFSWRGLVAVPVIFVLWANTHASAHFGLAFVGVVLLGRIVDSVRAYGWRVWEDAGVVRLAVALALAIPATFVNPHGIDLYHRALVMGRHATLAATADWRPLGFGWQSGWHWSFMASLLVAAVTFVWGGRRASVASTLGLLAAGIVACVQVRLDAAWVLVLPWALAPYWSAIRWQSFPRWTDWLTSPWFLPAWFALLAVAGLMLYAAAVLRSGNPSSHLVYEETPWKLADQLQHPDVANPPNPELEAVLRAGYPEGRYYGPVLATPKPGDYLMNALPNDSPVTYPRPELFPTAYWDELKGITDAKGSWWEALDRKGFNLVVVEPGMWPNLREELGRAGNWRVVSPRPVTAEEPIDLSERFVAVRLHPIAPPAGSAP